MVQPGATLTDEIVSRLANLGVDAVWVEGTADDAKPLDQLLAELEGRFAGHDNDLLMRELKAVVADCIRQGAADTRD